MPIKITPILGVVEVQNAELVEAKPAANNTRWIFDVEGTLDDSLVVQLVEMRTRRPLSPDLVACSFLARSAAFYYARPFLAEQEGGRITIQHGGERPVTKDEEGLPGGIKGIDCRYRVMIDVLHTATR